MNKFCIFCGSSIPEQALFCNSCGKRQEQTSAPPTVEDAVKEASAAVSVSETTNEPVSEPIVDSPIAEYDLPTKAQKKVNKNFIITLARNSLLLAVATVLFILSFMPIMKLETEDEFMMEGIDVSFSAIDFFVFTADAAKDYEDDDIVDSKLYEKIEELQEEFEDDFKDDFDPDEIAEFDDFDDLPKEYQRRLKNIVFLYVRLAFQSNTVELSSRFILPAVSSALYLLVSLAFLVFATLNFLTSFNLLKKASKLLSRFTLLFLAATPATVLFAYVVPYLCMGDRMYTSMASAIIAYLIIASIAVVLITAFAFVFKQHERKFNIPLRAASIALSVVVICMSFLPVYTATIKTIFDGKTKKSEVQIPVIVSSFADFAISEVDEDSIDRIFYMDDDEKEEYFALSFEAFGSYTKRELANGYGDGVHTRYLVEIFSSNKSLASTKSVSLVPIAFTLTVLLASFVLALNLFCFMTGVPFKKLTLTGKILTAVFAACALACVIIVLAGIVSALYCVPKGYSITIGVGAILLLVFAVANLCIPSGKSEPIEIQEQE